MKIQTSEDTLCKSYVKKASVEFGSAAAGREDKKVEKYNNLSDNYYFVVVGVKIYGAYGPQGIKLIKQEATGEKLSIFYLLQSISMAIQRSLGCPKLTSAVLEGLSNFHVLEAELL